MKPSNSPNGWKLYKTDAEDPFLNIFGIGERSFLLRTIVDGEVVRRQ